MNVLLLDFNGVIVDDESLHFASFREVLATQGIALDRATYDQAYLGSNDRAAFSTALAREGRVVDEGAVRGFVACKAARYAELAEQDLVLVPGVTAFVRAAAALAHIAVVSGALRAEIESGLVRAGLRDVVETIVSADDVPASKPDPAGFRLALARLAGGPGHATARAVVIEDSLPGLAAARSLGAGCAMLTTSLAAPMLPADVIWDTFEGHAPSELEALYRPVETAS